MNKFDNLYKACVTEEIQPNHTVVISDNGIKELQKMKQLYFNDTSKYSALGWGMGIIEDILKQIEQKQGEQK